VSVIALIPAGGASRRMGEDKLQLQRSHLAQNDLGRESVLEHIVKVALKVADRVIVLAPPESVHLAAEIMGSVRVVRDKQWHQGPLHALANAWPSTDEATWVLVAAGDVPGLTPSVLEACKAALGSAEDTVDGVMVKRAGRPQPLLGCYRARAGRTFQMVAQSGVQRMMSATDRLAIQYIDATLWPMWWTRPIHTPTDYTEWLESEDSE
jgi:molybdopterin-guanine dinucleotide biosynthesis protein A